MARQDINMDAIYGEVNLANNLTSKAIYEFRLLEDFDGPYGSSYLYGEITVPADFETKYNDGEGFCTYIDYIGQNKALFIRLKVEHLGGAVEYIRCSQPRSHWFSPVERTGNEITPLLASELYRINENGNFRLRIEEDHLLIYSGDDTDFLIKPSQGQNEVLLLKAFAGNLYQHPTTGVGLVEFLHGNFENSGLAAKLQSEFENDKMVVKNAYMDSGTGELYLDVEEKNG